MPRSGQVGPILPELLAQALLPQGQSHFEVDDQGKRLTSLPLNLAGFSRTAERLTRLAIAIFAMGPSTLFGTLYRVRCKRSPRPWPMPHQRLFSHGQILAISHPIFFPQFFSGHEQGLSRHSPCPHPPGVWFKPAPIASPFARARGLFRVFDRLTRRVFRGENNAETTRKHRQNEGETRWKACSTAA